MRGLAARRPTVRQRATPGYPVLAYPGDTAGLQPLPDWANLNGCRGPSRYEGLNRACPLHPGPVEFRDTLNEAA